MNHLYLMDLMNNLYLMDFIIFLYIMDFMNSLYIMEYMNSMYIMDFMNSLYIIDFMNSLYIMEYMNCICLGLTYWAIGWSLSNGQGEYSTPYYGNFVSRFSLFNIFNLPPPNFFNPYCRWQERFCRQRYVQYKYALLG